MEITTPQLPPIGYVGQPYRLVLGVSGAKPPLSWQLDASQLPPGLAFDAGSGVISGTPTDSAWQTVLVVVQDSYAPPQSAQKYLTFRIQFDNFAVTTSALPPAQIGQTYQASLAASGGLPPFTWSVRSGLLPGGISLVPASGLLSGTPQAAGTSTCTFTVTDRASQTASRELSLVVSAVLSASNEPVGSIVAWAGIYPTFADWVLCDGRAYSPAQYPELFAVIGTSYGAPTADNQSFCVPNLAGQFLRGVTHASPNDPDALTRTVPQPHLAVGGNSGNAVGSVQGYGTAQPRNTFTAAVYGLPTGNNSCLSPAGAPDDICISHSDQWDNHWTDTSGGGDAETRPINKSVWYLIKARAQTIGGAVTLPVGAVIACAAPDATGAGGFVFCDGRQADAANTALFAAIGTVNGGSDEANYYVPDYRGYFVRGTGYPPTYDPEAALRGPARPDLPPNQQGTSGMNPGSSQDWATGRPQTKFQTNFVWCPDDGVHAWNSAGSRDGRTNWGNSVKITLTGARGTAGDAESRPSNYAVDWLIKAQAAAEPPIGAMIAYGGSLPLPDSARNWRPCHGQTILPGDPAFAAISAAIGSTYGKDGAGIKLPDYRGLFLRGRDCQQGRDPDGKDRAVGSLELFATGAPTVPFTATPANLPIHGEQVFNSGPHSPGNWPDGDYTTIPTNTRGGDKETRPTNSYVEFLIRVS